MLSQVGQDGGSVGSRLLISSLAAPSSLIRPPLVTLVMVQFKLHVSSQTQTNSMAALWVTVGCSWANAAFPESPQ